MSEELEQREREEEWDRRYALRRKKERQEKRLRRVRTLRLLLCLGILVVCAGTGVLAAGLVRRGRGEKGTGSRVQSDVQSGQSDPQAGSQIEGDQEAGGGSGEADDPVSGEDGMTVAEAAGGTGAAGGADGAGTAGGGNGASAAGTGDLPLLTDDTEMLAEVKRPREDLPDIRATYGIFVSGNCWSSNFINNSYAMVPLGCHITAIRASLQGQSADLPGTVEYRVSMKDQGWQDWLPESGEAGDGAGEQVVESVCMRLTDELARYYDIMYSVLQEDAWTDWVKNGEEAGEAGSGKEIDGLRVAVGKRHDDGVSYAGNFDPNKPMIALTYDDGPSKSVTPRILSKLQECGGRATFFMVGVQAEKNLDLPPRMIAQGCEVANHTYDHTLMTKVQPEELAGQLIHTNEVVSGSCGISPVLMRPCGGATNDAGMMIAGAVAMPAVLWSIDTLDWKTRDAQNTIATVLDQVKDGDIILMHDIYDATADASEVLIPELVNRGFQLVTVSELASYRGGMKPGKTYSRFRP